MLRSDVIELVNSGQAWAFVGAGASCDAGAPNWRDLTGQVAARLGSLATSDPQVKRAVDRGEWGRAFEQMQHLAGRGPLESAVSDALSKVTAPGKLLQTLAGWRFAGYVTTNYDDLLYMALSATRNSGGWARVGNLSGEVKRISGEINNVIWHLHGSLALDAARSRLVLTESDYDNLYVHSNVIPDRLSALLTMRRFIFVGFSFTDPEVFRLIKMIGQLTTPDYPIVAFAATGDENERAQLLTRYNIDVIPYDAPNNDHSQLLQLLDLYGSLVLRRDISFGQPRLQAPSYDEEATSLLVYNQLFLSRDLNDTTSRLLYRARVMPLLGTNGSMTFGGLCHALIPGADESRDGIGIIEATMSELMRSGYVLFKDDRYELSELGRNIVEGQSARVAVLHEQFVDSLFQRVREGGLGEDIARQVANVASAFLLTSANKRSLGVAMALISQGQPHQQYQAVALLQSLPSFLPQLTSMDAAQALVRLIQDVLGHPSAEEARYVGLVLQAQFGICLLGHDPGSVAVRAEEIGSTVFVVDSSTLIPFLARGSLSSRPARLLMSRLNELGAPCVTTPLLAEEVAEHVRWALKHVDPKRDYLTSLTLQAALGLAGARSNAFLEGFLYERASSTRAQSFIEYLGETVSMRSSVCSDKDIQQVLSSEHVTVIPLDDFDGFQLELFHERDEIQERIAARRQARGTFTHDRQVKAEAEVVLIVRGLRAQELTLQEHPRTGAFFVSYTRIVDELQPARPITLRPESLLQWLATVKPLSIDEHETLMYSLLWELEVGGVQIVDRATLSRAFSPLVSASRDTLGETRIQHRELIAARYGIDGGRAFSDLALPIIVESEAVQKAARLEQEVKSQRERLAAAALSVRDRQELARLREEKNKRKRLAKKKKARSKSRRGR